MFSAERGGVRLRPLWIDDDEVDSVVADVTGKLVNLWRFCSGWMNTIDFRQV